MSIHPEMEDSQFGDLIRSVDNMATTKVWCRGCKDYTVMNGAYARYVSEIESCRKCRNPR
jgi:hypothetical protein